MAMPNIRFGYSVKKNSFKGLDIDCIQYSNIIWITYYSYSYSGTTLNPNIICIRIRPNICAQILFVFVFAHSEKTNIIRIRIRSKFWCRILFVFVFGQKNSIRSPLLQMSGACKNEKGKSLWYQALPQAITMVSIKSSFIMIFLGSDSILEKVGGENSTLQSLNLR